MIGKQALTDFVTHECSNPERWIAGRTGVDTFRDTEINRHISGYRNGASKMQLDLSHFGIPMYLQTELVVKEVSTHSPVSICWSTSPVGTTFGAPMHWQRLNGWRSRCCHTSAVRGMGNPKLRIDGRTLNR
jgi:hypothetical protein